MYFSESFNILNNRVFWNKCDVFSKKSPMFAELFQSAFWQKPLKKSKIYFFPLERYCLNTNKKNRKKISPPNTGQKWWFSNFIFCYFGVFSSKNALTFFRFFVKIAIFFFFKIQVNSKSALSLEGGHNSTRFSFFWK